MGKANNTATMSVKRDHNKKKDKKEKRREEKAMELKMKKQEKEEEEYIPSDLESSESESEAQTEISTEMKNEIEDLKNADVVSEDEESEESEHIPIPRKSRKRKRASSDSNSSKKAKTEEKSFWVVENAKSGRAKCRHCMEKIEKAALRVGREGWMAGRKATLWFHPNCALQNPSSFDKAPNGRGKCKYSGEKILNGEDRFGIEIHNSTQYVKAKYVMEVCNPVIELMSEAFDFSSVPGFNDLPDDLKPSVA